MLLIFRPFTAGQFIEAGGHEGTVAEIGLFATTLDTPDNRRIYVPNSAIMNGVIHNYSHHDVRRVDLDVTVPHAVPVHAPSTARSRCRA